MERPGPENVTGTGILFFTSMSQSQSVVWNGIELELMAECAIHWRQEETLFLADPHFGKTATFREAGIPVPEQTTRDDCERIAELIVQTKSRRLIFLGDFFHSRIGKTVTVRDSLLLWRGHFPEVEMHLIRGNHDLSAGDPWTELSICCHPDPWTFRGLECRHSPVGQSPHFYLAGHVHPGFTLKGRGRNSIRAACFHLTHSRIVLPAFGSFTGLSTVRPELGDRIFMTNRKEIVEAHF